MKSGKTACQVERESGKGHKDAGIKKLMGNSHESRRVEETSEGGQVYEL
jgi:hypothetical protein